MVYTNGMTRSISRPTRHVMTPAHAYVGALTLLFGLAISIAWQAPPAPDKIELIFLDVGQGDAMVVRSPEGRVALIDAGRGWLIGQLGVHGIDSIDVAIATHPHADHIGGMVDVLRDLPVETYIDNGVPHTTAIYSQVMAAVAQSGARYMIAESTTVPLGSVQLLILPPFDGAESLNNGSIGVVITYGDFSALVAGDAEIDALNHFIESGVPDVTVLKASHHGARDGVSPAWLSATRPETVVISVGKDNGYGHPHDWAIEYYKAIADEIYRTDLHGEITILGSHDGTYEVRNVRGDRFARTADQPLLKESAIDEGAFIDVWVYPNALGYDQFNLNGEYAVIKNTSSTTIDVGEWRLCNIERRCFTFPTDAAIAASDSVIVYSGVGHQTAAEFFMRQTQPIWDDNTGRAILSDRDGRVMARYAY